VPLGSHARVSAAWEPPLLVVCDLLNLVSAGYPKRLYVELLQRRVVETRKRVSAKGEEVFIVSNPISLTTKGAQAWKNVVSDELNT